MNRSYTKLFSSIVTSSLWGEDSDTRVIWVTMLALADSYGEVMATIPGLARAANVHRDKVSAAIGKFLGEDPDSRTKTGVPGQEIGQRIEVIDGGWRLINYDLYRRLMSAEERKEYKRIKEQERRNRLKGRGQRVDNHGQNVDSRGRNMAEEEGVLGDEKVPFKPLFDLQSNVRQIYQAYPRKVGKKAAELKIRRAIAALAICRKLDWIDASGNTHTEDFGLDQIKAADWVLRSTQEFAGSPAGQQGQMTAHPATWFHQERFLDDRREWYKVGKTGKSGGSQLSEEQWDEILDNENS